MKPEARTVYRRKSSAWRLDELQEPIPDLSPTSILIRVRAVSLNYRDCNILNGTKPWSTLDSGIPCSDAAGEVLAIGSHVSRFSTGDKVLAIVDQKAITGDEQERQWLGGEVDGVLASHLVMDEQVCVHMPDVSWAEAACLPNAGLTAWSSLATNGRLVAGQTVLLQGTGGVCMMAMKLAMASGCNVIVTSSSDQKLAQLKAQLKSIHTINYATTDWEIEAKKIGSIDIILENGGTSSILQSIRAIKTGGTISQVGYLGQQDVKLEGLVPLLIEKTVNWRGINVGSRQDFEQMNTLIEATNLRFTDIIDKNFHFSKAHEAFEYLWSGKHTGKIIIELD